MRTEPRTPRTTPPLKPAQLAGEDPGLIFVTVNMWDRQAKAMMEVYAAVDPTTDGGGIREFWTDVNIDNNSLNCSSFQPRK